MTEQNSPSTKGSALPLLLGILLLVVIGVGGWYFLGRDGGTGAGDTIAAGESRIPEQSPSSELDPGSAPQENTVVEPIVPDTSVPVETQSEGATTDGSAGENPVVDSGPVTIDVAKAMGTRAIGNPQAPVKIIEYASLTCSHCAHFHNDVLPDLKTKYIDTGKVYLEFREFPLNDPALKATLTARCLPEDKYESFISLLFKTQDHWAAGIDYMSALKQNAKLAGMSDATFEACHNEPQLKLAVAENMQQAKDKWNISATPTFIVNDGAETISGAQPLEEFERVFRKVTGDAVGSVPAVE